MSGYLPSRDSATLSLGVGGPNMTSRKIVVFFDKCAVFDLSITFVVLLGFADIKTKLIFCSHSAG